MPALAPLAWQGLDTCLSIMETLHTHLGDKYRPCPLLSTYVAGGQLGQKTGRGVFFYELDKRGDPVQSRHDTTIASHSNPRH